MHCMKYTEENAGIRFGKVTLLLYLIRHSYSEIIMQ